MYCNETKKYTYIRYVLSHIINYRRVCKTILTMIAKEIEICW